jgi:hypothetical protein
MDSGPARRLGGSPVDHRGPGAKRPLCTTPLRAGADDLVWQVIASDLNRNRDRGLPVFLDVAFGTTKEIDMATTTIRNGVDVDQLVQTIDAIKSDENIASFTFRAKTKWQEGSTSLAEIERFTHAGQHQRHASTHTLTGCEPAVLLGATRARMRWS